MNQIKLYKWIQIFTLMVTVSSALFLLFSGYVNIVEIMDFSSNSTNKDVFLYTVSTILMLLVSGSLIKFNITNKVETYLLVGLSVLVIGLVLMIVFIIIEIDVESIIYLIPSLVGFSSIIFMVSLRLKTILEEHVEIFK